MRTIKKTIKMLGRLLYWATMLALGLIVGIVALICLAWRGDRITVTANTQSGMEG